MSEKNMRVVVCAANAYKDLIVTSARHFDANMHKQIMQSSQLALVAGHSWEQGFIDQWGIFMDRKEALSVAISAGQINTRRPKGNPTNILFSEDLY